MFPQSCAIVCVIVMTWSSQVSERTLTQFNEEQSPTSIHPYVIFCFWLDIVHQLLLSPAMLLGKVRHVSL